MSKYFFSRPVLGFKNTVEAICCLGKDVFNNQFKIWNDTQLRK